MSNEFEKYPVLTEHIREYASFGHFSNWSSFLAELNQALAKGNPPPPASAEEEAARMYPYHSFLRHDTTDKLRQAHITCAGMYTDTIDNLKAENSKMRKALEDDGWIKIEDFAIVNLPDYDELVLWRDERGLFFVEMLDKDGNPWLEKPYKVTHWKKIVHPKE